MVSSKGRWFGMYRGKYFFHFIVIGYLLCVTISQCITPTTAYFTDSRKVSGNITISTQFSKEVDKETRSEQENDVEQPLPAKNGEEKGNSKEKEEDDEQGVIDNHNLDDNWVEKERSTEEEQQVAEEQKALQSK
ncbi:hypothetical protein CAI16_16365 [Virgibacillus dokdonensis]|uniref:Uncharacterized protein n=1 Tax=Virgibacillus dokdonensis TaxID=302167 RepID=A0A3E0WM12_9BACI|nr:hypothetical protein [Virgibacillus dokdonensis]RFA32985.1 hypothetical protein CAI16_16365 [Virgibacillus dokdonensis]